MHNLRIAAAFSEVMIVRMDAAEINSTRSATEVPCNGSRALFAAFTACFPDLARNPTEKHPHNRQGVTAIELNKALQVLLDSCKIVAENC